MKKQIRNFLLLTTMTTISIYGINKAISVSSIRKNLLKSDNGKFFTWRYGEIFYTKQGKGSPVLLIHDLNPASSSYEWEKCIKHLAKNHTVGCGQSDKPNMTYSNYLFVQLITDFIKNVIGEKADIITTGNSASFTLMACNMNPEHFNKIIVLNPTNLVELCASPNKEKNALKFLIDLPVIGTLIYNIAFCGKNIKNLFEEKYYYKGHMVSTKTLDTYYESAHLQNSRGKYLLSSIKANYTNINIVHALKKINNSIYLVGSREQNGITEIMNSYVAYNPSIEASYVDNSKYLPQLECPERLLKLLNLYLESK
ncbi:MAG: alpha/beta hydrolase [Clostridium sp. 42_12]|nr:MAG: alpha/beta hydrolase [Clostridium sp. 42_12]